MATLQTWRKVYGAIKDATEVGLAKVTKEFKDVDVAIVKASNHVECSPKERHIRKILADTSVMQPQADVAYCMHSPAWRLAKTDNWMRLFSSMMEISRPMLGLAVIRSESVIASSSLHLTRRLSSSGPQQQQEENPESTVEEKCSCHDSRAEDKHSESGNVNEEEEDDDVGVYVNKQTGEIGGPKGPEPTRYGDWERGGRCSDF
ncbi:PREDICTED: putative clathrin assembly protein At5g57200 [Nelumbo nucifera]|uniref:Succinate dehydrogenase assembly factor 4, mitochondrial n=2 Tax=Nelumbo nucifera TaxID=4432 RepID=A0A1U8B580_NELNU|nr:PREDICTED: putative clathrin assembly protein At5g57200 [Nelumbo nucifera]DAD32169.1 TPA_asm: hypothetical protein HUJ06_011020 [Nelumbo nucifera]